MIQVDRLHLALAAALAAMSVGVVAAGPAHAEAEVGSPKWAAEQFRQLGLKAVPDHGYQVSVRTRTGRAPEALAMLPGSDPLLARDVILVTGRLDAASAAAVIAAARTLSAGSRPRRTVVFLLSDVEAADRQAGVAADHIVADLDLSDASASAGLALTAASETSLGRDADALAATAGFSPVSLAVDARTAGVLSQGAPTIGLGFGGEDAGRFATYLSSLVSLVADRDARPAWALGSRFAPPAPRAEQVLTDPVDLPLSHRPQRPSQANG